MCRIFGISYGGEPEIYDDRTIARLMYRNLVNGGVHAWGWFGSSAEDGLIYSQKNPGRVDTPGAEASYHREIGDGQWNWFVGHVRQATHGRPQYNGNNHPLQHGSIMGVHNGVLINHEDILAITGREDPTAIVDSEAIFAAVNKWGHTPGLKKIVGKMVAVYSDVRRPHLLHIARTYGRSLSIGWTANGNLIFASERQALWMLEDHGIKFTDFSSVTEMRHLVVREGKIIHRHTFGQVPPGMSTPPRSVSIRRELPELLRIMPSPQEDPLAAWHRVAPKPRVNREDVIAHLHEYEHQYGYRVDDNTYYYQGLLMTADQYVDALVEDLEWED